MKIWRYNACFCCLNCLPRGRQFPSLVSGYSNLCKTPHTATNCRLLPDGTRTRIRGRDNQCNFLLFRDESKLGANLFVRYINYLCHALSWALSNALRNVLNQLYPMTFWSWIIPAEMRAWVWTELCDMETECLLQHNDLSGLDLHWRKNLGFKNWLIQLHV